MSGPDWMRRPALAAGVAAAALALGACGDDEDSTTAATAPTTEATTPTVAVQSAVEGFDAQTLYSEAAPSVVTILSVIGGGGDSGSLGGAQVGQGSGFVINDDGEIVTNAHVITDADGTNTADPSTIEAASEVYVEFGDRNQVEAEILGFDPNADVALLKVDPEGLELNPIELGDSAAVEVGAPVAAIGSPFGQERSLSTGIVSATDRSIDSLTDFKIDGAIQTDASINPGNSGGPLIAADGRVIGIDQQINTTSGGNEGVGFAVPINLAKRSIDQLRENGEVAYPYIGVATRTLYPQLAEELDLDTDAGVLVTSVTEGSPAADAGLVPGDEEDQFRFQAQRVIGGGDVIVEADGEKLVADGDLSRAILDKNPGDTVTLKVLRDGDELDVDLELGNRNDAPPAS